MTTRNQYRVVNPADLADLTNQVNTILLQIGTRMDQGERPVNSLFFNTDNVNPGTTLGYGTWELFGSGTDVLTFDAADSGYGTLVFVFKRTA